MKKKGVLIAIIIAVIVIVIAIGCIAVYIAKGFSQELAIKNQIQEIDQMTSDIQTINLEDFNKKTDTIVTTGNYAIVEQAVKQYIKDSINYTLEINSLLQDDTMANLVTAENYQTDGPDFTETTRYITESKTKLEEAKNEFSNMFTEEKIMSYINGKTDNQKFIDLYKEVAIGNQSELIPQEELDTVNSSLDAIINILNIEQEMIDLLKNNSGKWQVQNDMVMFDSNDLLIKYNALVGRLNLAASAL
mgnify:FL=1